VRALQRDFGDVALQAFRPQVDKRQMAVGAARDKINPASSSAPAIALQFSTTEAV
jgi:hypothetical protein